MFGDAEMVSSEGLSAPLSPPQAVVAKQYGVTKPISKAGPTEADVQRTVELEKVCAVDFFFLSERSFRCDSFMFSENYFVSGFMGF